MWKPSDLQEQEVNYEREANGLQEAKDLIRSRVSDVKSLLSYSWREKILPETGWQYFRVQGFYFLSSGLEIWGSDPQGSND